MKEASPVIDRSVTGDACYLGFNMLKQSNNNNNNNNRFYIPQF